MTSRGAAATRARGEATSGEHGMDEHARKIPVPDTSRESDTDKGTAKAESKLVLPPPPPGAPAPKKFPTGVFGDSAPNDSSRPQPAAQRKRLLGEKLGRPNWSADAENSSVSQALAGTPPSPPLRGEGWGRV